TPAYFAIEEKDSVRDYPDRLKRTTQRRLQSRRIGYRTATAIAVRERRPRNARYESVQHDGHANHHDAKSSPRRSAEHATSSRATSTIRGTASTGSENTNEKP